VEALLDSGALPDQPSNGGWRPLHCAAAGGHADVCTSLLARRCEPAPSTAEGDTPLHWAARSGCADICAALLLAGAPPLPGSGSGCTPLHTAAEHGATDVVELLLKAGGRGCADVCDRGSSTPLHAAAGAGHLEVARVLLAAGASLDVVSNTGFTPLNHASGARCSLLLCCASCTHPSRSLGLLPRREWARGGGAAVDAGRRNSTHTVNFRLLWLALSNACCCAAHCNAEHKPSCTSVPSVPVPVPTTAEQVFPPVQRSSVRRAPGAVQAV